MVTFNSVPQHELLQIVSQLEQAMYNHQQWYNELIRTLVCRLAGNESDLLPDAHTRCRFGQWYYGHMPETMKDHPEIVNIGHSHHRMHQLAAKMLQSTLNREDIPPHQYDRFANAIEQMRLELSTLKSELQYLMHSRDPLTGALSRMSMSATLREQQEFVKRQDQACCLVMVDLDYFKDINDTHGHQTGDKVLASAARYFIENLRAYDKVFRYGGEEFLFCLPFTDLQTAYSMSERLRKGLADITVENSKGEYIPISASFGIAELEAHGPIEKSIDHADRALYAAKSNGRNTVKIWSNEDDLNVP